MLSWGGTGIFFISSERKEILSYMRNQKQKEAALYLDQLEDAITRIELTDNLEKADVLKALKVSYWLMREWLRSSERKEA